MRRSKDSLQIVAPSQNQSKIGTITSACYLENMLCFEVPYSHKGGNFVAMKFADDAAEALKIVQAGHRKVSLASCPKVGAIEYGRPVASNPQPFADTAAIIDLPLADKKGIAA